jgi:hypothetical protein
MNAGWDKRNADQTPVFLDLPQSTTDNSVGKGTVQIRTTEP